MKKIKYLLVILSFVLMVNVNAVSSNASIGSDLTEYSCSKFQDSNMHISGDTYFGRCMQATCNGSSWQLRYYSTNSVTCSNGNLNPYIKITKTGCDAYQNNSCRSTTVKYCTTISYFDCNRTSNGSKFTTTTTKPKTTKPSTTIETTTVITTTTPVLNNNTYLSSLTLSNGIIQFNKEVKEYSITVGSTISFINVQAVAEASTSNVLVQGNANLVSGNNTITITVTAEDGSVGTYTINVVKEEKASSNAKLASLTIEGYDIDFSRDNTNYLVKTKDSVLNIKAEAEDLNATVKIEGNSNLTNNSVVKVIVVAADNITMQEYLITVKTPSSGSGLVTALFIIVLIAVIGGGAFYFYTKKKNGGEKEYEYE